VRVARLRLHAVAVIVRRQIYEMVLNPGLYISLALGLLLGGLVLNGFTASVDTSGFDPSLSPAFALLARLLEGGFGLAFVDRLFSEGPFLLALLAALVPVLVYLALSSVFRFGLEKNVGAVELLAYGPADATAYAVASYLRDVLLTAVVIVVLLAYFAVAAAGQNLVLGPMFLRSLVSALFVSLAVYAWGILACSVASNAASSLALFGGTMVALLALQASTVAVGASTARTGARAIGWMARWVSPFTYASLGARAAETGAALGFAASMAALVALSCLLLGASRAVLLSKGVRE
jgi:hypothetical protein